MVVRCLALEPTLTTGRNNLDDFLNMPEKLEPFDILDFRRLLKSGAESYADLDLLMPLEDLPHDHYF
jgi:hypothetical protein